jgi:GNAT superfamily N-acetyltransferase
VKADEPIVRHPRGEIVARVPFLNQHVEPPDRSYSRDDTSPDLQQTADPVSIVEEVRPATESEVGELEDLQRRASLVWEEYRDDLLAHPEAIEVPLDAVRDRLVRVAFGGGRLLGFSVVLPLADAVTELDGLFVEPSFMGRGVGRCLIDDAVAIARERGVRRVEVTANPRAVGFYERIGFVAEGPVPTRFGPGLRMHLDISS